MTRTDGMVGKHLLDRAAILQQTMKELVSGEAGLASNLGIGIIPISAIESIPSGTVVKKIDGLKLELPVGIVRSPEHNFLNRPIVDSLVEILSCFLTNYVLLLS
jgi:hypothetical protein